MALVQRACSKLKAQEKTPNLGGNLKRESPVSFELYMQDFDAKEFTASGVVGRKAIPEVLGFSDCAASKADIGSSGFGIETNDHQASDLGTAINSGDQYATVG